MESNYIIKYNCNRVILKQSNILTQIYWWRVNNVFFLIILSFLKVVKIGVALDNMIYCWKVLESMRCTMFNRYCSAFNFFENVVCGISCILFVYSSCMRKERLFLVFITWSLIGRTPSTVNQTHPCLVLTYLGAFSLDWCDSESFMLIYNQAIT